MPYCIVLLLFADSYFLSSKSMMSVHAFDVVIRLRFVCEFTANCQLGCDCVGAMELRPTSMCFFLSDLRQVIVLSQMFVFAWYLVRIGNFVQNYFSSNLHQQLLKLIFSNIYRNFCFIIFN